MLLNALENENCVDVLNAPRLKVRTDYLLLWGRIVSRQRHRVVDVPHSAISNWCKFYRACLLLRSVYCSADRSVTLVGDLRANLLSCWNFLVNRRRWNLWQLYASVGYLNLGPVQILIIGWACLARWPLNPFDIFFRNAFCNNNLLLHSSLWLGLLALRSLVLTEKAFRNSDWTSSISWYQIIVGHIDFLCCCLVNDLLNHGRLRHLVDGCWNFGTFVFQKPWCLLRSRRRIPIHHSFGGGTLGISLLSVLLRLIGDFLTRAIIIPSLFLCRNTSYLLALWRWYNLGLLSLIFLICFFEQIMDGTTTRENDAGLRRLKARMVCHDWSSFSSVVCCSTLESLYMLIYLIYK